MLRSAVPARGEPLELAETSDSLVLVMLNLVAGFQSLGTLLAVGIMILPRGRRAVSSGPSSRAGIWRHDIAPPQRRRRLLFAMVSASNARLVGIAGFLLMAAIAVATFVPAAWQVRLGLHWLAEHFLAYFAVTTVFCLATRRPMAVAAALLPLAIVLESLQALTADRVADPATALFAATGVASAALLADRARALWR